MWFRLAIYDNAVLFFCALALSAAASVANIKIRYGAKTPLFAIFGTRVICVFYSTQIWQFHMQVCLEVPFSIEIHKLLCNVLGTAVCN